MGLQSRGLQKYGKKYLQNVDSLVKELHLKDWSSTYKAAIRKDVSANSKENKRECKC